MLPSARRYARENGVNLAEVSPKTNDVVRKEDIDKKQQAPASTQTTQQAPAKEKKYNQYPTKPVIREKCHAERKQLLKIIRGI